MQYRSNISLHEDVFYFFFPAYISRCISDLGVIFCKCNNLNFTWCHHSIQIAYEVRENIISECATYNFFLLAGMSSK